VNLNLRRKKEHEMTDWNKDRAEYRRGAEAVTGEAPWTIWKSFTHIILPLIAVVALGGVATRAMGWWGEAADVAQKEFGPKAMLKNYEWFVDQASRIDKMDADVALYAQRVKSLDGQYASYGADRSLWPPDVRMEYDRKRSQAADDLTSIASQRNNLVREYNAQSEKFNWEPFNSKSDRPKPRYDESPSP
jgi:hypothetical protein